MKIKLFRYFSEADFDKPIERFGISFHFENFGMFNRIEFETKEEAVRIYEDLKAGRIKVSLELLDEYEIEEK